jgi:hypothetical protein
VPRSKRPTPAERKAAKDREFIEQVHAIRKAKAKASNGVPA